MSFQMPERPATLVFEDGPLEGLELEVRLAVPFDFYFEMVALQGSPNGKKSKTPAEQLAQAKKDAEEARDLMRRFAEVALIGWNLVGRDGKSVPATPDAFTAHVDPLSFGAMLGRYLSAIGGKPGPLAPRSGAGAMSKGRKASSSPSS